MDTQDASGEGIIISEIWTVQNFVGDKETTRNLLLAFFLDLPLVV